MPHRASRGPGRPPAAKAAETRDRILDAARDVFGELGYDAATFQAIAQRADLTRPAINHYFANKRVLYREVLQQINAQVFSSVTGQAGSDGTLAGRVSALLGAFVGVDESVRSDGVRSSSAFLVTSVLEAQRHPDLQFPGHDVLANTRAFIVWAVDAAVRGGELRDDVDAAAVVEMLVATLWGVGFHAGYVRGPVDVARVSGQLRGLLDGSLRAARS